jgi:hypothetical protein
MSLRTLTRLHPFDTLMKPNRAKMKQSEEIQPNPEKDPEDWVTGDEPMTGPQISYLHTLAREAGEKVNDSLTKAEASKKIDELQEKTGRGA